MCVCVIFWVRYLGSVALARWPLSPLTVQPSWKPGELRGPPLHVGVRPLCRRREAGLLVPWGYFNRGGGAPRTHLTPVRCPPPAFVYRGGKEGRRVACRPPPPVRAVGGAGRALFAL